MEYTLEIDDTPSTVPGGTGILLLHPSTGETDRIDTEFFKTDTDKFLVVSTRTTAREARQKLEYYDVDEESAEILDTLSIERGHSRRSSDTVHYVSAPDDIDAILEHIDGFLDAHEGKLRVSIDSVTELAYYADDEAALEAVEAILELLEEYDAIGLFHLSEEVHDDEIVDAFRDRFDGVIDLDEDGTVAAEF
ncbi:hypothetical protein HALLA_19345 [Halostagnicola larsenii XH-48]|uniref:ATPase involved in flagella biogenesis n=1 Tax=Halostagnicola larsenii XH-48 TaxID=797299 RepID=W0JU95_9EURY|nr:ATPase involved in flagella biogenesis [Halostagnicola larsenii]AHG00623.1 hypothetical protein HALLA_19345 [Halostagnicola larsenii XH-48]